MNNNINNIVNNPYDDFKPQINIKKTKNTKSLITTNKLITNELISNEVTINGTINELTTNELTTNRLTSKNSFLKRSRSTININNSTDYTVAFNSTDINYDNATDYTITSSTRTTIDTAGLYFIQLEIWFSSNSNGGRRFYIRINGSSTRLYNTHQAASGGLATHLTASGMINFAKNDYFEVIAKQYSGTTITVNCSMTMYRIGSGY